MPRVLNYHLDRLPAGAVYIGRKWRHIPASKWGNPFIEGRHGTRAEVIAKYRAWICDQPELIAALPELRGRDLVCWCAPEACHGDLLLQLVNPSCPIAVDHSSPPCFWLHTNTRTGRITVHRDGCAVASVRLRHYRARRAGVWTGPLTWAQVAALPARGYQACGRCKPPPPSAAAKRTSARGSKRRASPRPAAPG